MAKLDWAKQAPSTTAQSAQVLDKIASTMTDAQVGEVMQKVGANPLKPTSTAGQAWQKAGGDVPQSGLQFEPGTSQVDKWAGKGIVTPEIPVDQTVESPVGVTPPVPAEPTTISEAVDQTLKPYKEQAESIFAGSFLEAADTFENIFGKPAPYNTQEGYLEWRKKQSADDLAFLDKQMGYARQIEEVEFQKAKEQAAGAVAGTTAAMAQGREGAVSGTANMFTGEYKASVDRNMQQLQVQRKASELEREKQRADLVRAQEAGDMELAQAIQGRIDAIEQDLRNTDLQELQITTQAQQMNLEAMKFEYGKTQDQQANYRANLTTFGSLLQTGTVLDMNQLQSFAQSLNIPLEEVIGFYNGSQAIRDSVDLSVEEKRVALAENVRQLELKSQGYITETAQQIKGVMDLVKSGKLTQQEASDMMMGMGIDSSLNPMTNLQLRINGAQAILAEYEAKYAGQPPPEGSPERLDYDIKKLQLKQANLEYNALTTSYANELNSKEAFNALALTGGSRVSPSFAEGHKQCGEAYNDYTTQGGAGDSYQSKMNLVDPDKSFPQVGNGLVIPLKFGGGVVSNYQTEPGHIETIVSVNPTLNSFQTISYNRDGKGTGEIRNYTMDDLKKYGNLGENYGFTNSTLKDEYASKLTELAPPQTVEEGGYDVQALASLSDKELTSIRTVSGAFTSEPIVKNYNEVANKYASIQKIVDMGVGGPGDLALVFEFMKGLDPTSVVRESEYDAAAKSGNIFAGPMAKFNGYFKEEGGFLPDQVKQSFRDIVKTKYDIVSDQYDHLYDEYVKKINNFAGGKNVAGGFLIDYRPEQPKDESLVYGDYEVAIPDENKADYNIAPSTYF